MALHLKDFTHKFGLDSRRRFGAANDTKTSPKRRQEIQNRPGAVSAPLKALKRRRNVGKRFKTGAAPFRRR
jgi:hypothetical protein